MKKSIFISACAVLLCAAAVTAAVLLTHRTAPLEEYTIVYENINGGRVGNAARGVQRGIMNRTGTMPSIISQSEMPETAAGPEILVGNTGRAESIAATADFVTPMDYTIRVKKDQVVIVGGSSYATAAAAEKYLQLLESDEKALRKNGFSYSYSFDLSRINPICLDPSLFEPVWAKTYTPPEWLRDPHEKMYAVTHQDGRMTNLSHRGDFVNYPRTSLEGFCSAIMAGADATELDFRLTKDNIPVAMHDESLLISTNCASKKGRGGLPDSIYIGDWTYDELMQLNLVCDDGRQTPYKVATVYEVLLLAHNLDAIMTFDDKEDEVTHPVFAATGKTMVEDLLPFMLSTDSAHCFFYYFSYWYGMPNTKFWHSLEGTSETFQERLNFWDQCLADGRMTTPFSPWDDRRYKSWGYDHTRETPYYWGLWYSEGARNVWSNCTVKLSQYISENYQPYDYSSLLAKK